MTFCSVSAITSLFSFKVRIPNLSQVKPFLPLLQLRPALDQMPGVGKGDKVRLFSAPPSSLPFSHCLFLTRPPLDLDFLRDSCGEGQGPREESRTSLLLLLWSISIAFRDSSLELLTTTTSLLLLATYDVFSASECDGYVFVFPPPMSPCSWVKLSGSSILLRGQHSFGPWETSIFLCGVFGSMPDFLSAC